MSETRSLIGNWATESENTSNNSNNGDVEGKPNPWFPHGQQHSPVDAVDLRHRLRSKRGERSDESDTQPRQTNYRFDNERTSPPRSSHKYERPSSHRGSDTKRSSNYAHENNGLSPLRSPLNPEQRSSRVSYGSRRRMLKDGDVKKVEEGSSKSSPQKKNRYSNSSSPANPLTLLSPDVDEDRITLARREKQISYGKSTESYQLYSTTVARDDRGVDRKKHPRTPVKNRRCSRRNWDAQIKAWKKYIHNWANINCPSRRPLSEVSTSEQDSASQSTEDISQELKEIDDELDLNEEEEEDDSFLDDVVLTEILDDISKTDAVLN